LERVVGNTKYSRKAFAEERPQKHQGKEIQAKLLVTEKMNEELIIIITLQKNAKI